MSTEERVDEIRRRILDKEPYAWSDDDICTLLDEITFVSEERDAFARLMATCTVTACEVCKTTKGCQAFKFGFSDARNFSDYINVVKKTLE
jgi:hypothetical protein